MFVRTNCLGYIRLQAHNSTTAVVSCYCTLLHSCTSCKKQLPWWNCGRITQHYTTPGPMVQCTTHYGRHKAYCICYARWCLRRTLWNFTELYNVYDGTEQLWFSE